MSEILNKVRRKDREVTDEAWIKEFLKQAPTGVVGTSVDDQPFLNTVSFVYDEQQDVIYWHTNRQGRIFHNIESNPRVCFTVSQMGRLLPSTHASGMGTEYASVVVFGVAHILQDAVECKHGLQMLVDKYFPHLKAGKDYKPINDQELIPTAVYRLEIESWSAKQKKAAPDYKGAFRFQDILTSEL